MAPDFTLANFLKELGARLAAAAVVLGVFFATAFSLVGVAAAGWMALQQYRG